MPKYCLSEIAERIEGKVRGNPDVIISGVAGLEEARQGDISFLANPKYFNRLHTTNAAAVIIAESKKQDKPEQRGRKNES